MVSAFGRIGDATTSHAHLMAMVQDRGRSDANLVYRSLVRAAISRWRARASRDITVPIGTSVA